MVTTLARPEGRESRTRAGDVPQPGSAAAKIELIGVTKRFITPATTERSGFIAEAEHSDGISSFVLERQQPVEWPAFSRAMETLIALRGAELLRVKGILNVAGCRGPVVVQYVQHLAHPPVELQTWPDQNRDSRVVFITRNIREDAIRDLFAAVESLAKGGGLTSQRWR